MRERKREKRERRERRERRESSPGICIGDVENTGIYCKFYIIHFIFYIISINSRGHLTRGTPHFP